MAFAFEATETAAEWGRWHGRNVESAEGTIRLARERTPTYVSPRELLADADRPAPFVPVDVDVDECGDLYVLTAAAEIHRYDHRNGTLRRLPCTWYPEGQAGNGDGEGDSGTGGDAGAPSRDPVAICVTRDSIYVADGSLPGVAAFARPSHQLRWIARSAGEEPFVTPVALVGDGRTGYLLDGGSGEGEGFVARTTVTGFDDRPAVTGLHVPSDLARGDEGDLYVLDESVRDAADGGDGTDDPVPAVRRFSAADGDGTTSFSEVAGDEVWIPPEYVPRCIEVVTDRRVIVGVGTDPGAGTGRETTPYRYLPDSDRFERVASFKRTASALLLRRRATDGLGRGLYAISGPDTGTGADTDTGADTLYFLDEVSRNRLDTGTDRYDARAWRRLDSGLPGTEWHRVETALQLGERGTQVRLNYRATDVDDVGDLEGDLGIPPAAAARLREVGITGAWGVLEHDPETLAELASVTRESAAGWLERTRAAVDRDIQDVRGIGREYGDRFRFRGVRTVADLLGLDVDAILRIVDPQRGERDASAWLRRARRTVNRAVEGEWTAAVGLDPAAAAELRAAGIEEVAELLEHTPGALADRLRVPPDQATEWIGRAEARVEEAWTRGGSPASITNPRDALLDGAEGRYLWVELALVGSDVSSPLVDSFRAYFPRQSYLRYLPAIYREDERSAAFLERFLSVFESTFLGIEEEIGSVTRYLDAAGVPEEYLPWLGAWLAVETDETWPSSVTRAVIERAPELFEKRGTRDGLLELLGIYLDDPVTLPAAWETALERERERIEALADDGALTAAEATAELSRIGRFLYVLEYSDLDCIEDEDARAAYVAQLGCPQCFLVLAPPFLDDEAMDAIDRMVESGTPAHAVGRAVGLRPRVQLGGASHPGHTYLGVNSALSEPEFVVEEATLGTDAVLRERERSSRLELKSRLGTDTVIS